MSFRAAKHAAVTVAAALTSCVVPLSGCAEPPEAQPAKPQAAAAAPSTREEPVQAPKPNPETKPKFTNRLATSKSPYLRQHAHNPVDWYPWGEEAFEKARKEGKPIFLSVGYSTCHWCHVMEREAFSDEETAAVLNEHFVPIKVDREERPDVDKVYMTYVQAITGRGGWPLNVVLTPELKPFFGGTYFPHKAKGGMPPLKLVLERIHASWRDDRERVVDVANSAVEGLAEIVKVAEGEEGAAAAGVEKALLDRAYTRTAATYDAEHGGFGQAPKFPEPAQLEFMLRYHARGGDAPARDMTLHTLRAMAAGGMWDHLGGGFHRYSTDERWFLPHFEKMLYDQGQLAAVYVDAYQLTRDESYARVARETIEYVLRDMTGPQGQFYSAEDADSARPGAAADSHEKAEGAFYVWSADEIRKVLGDEAAAVFSFHYGAADKGNVDADPHGEFPGLNVLYAAHTADETATKFGKSAEDVDKLLGDARVKLFKVREARPRPHLDDKTIVAWNALMISALAKAGPALKEPRYSEAAARAAGFIEENLWDAKSKRLSRVWREGPSGVDGFLDDYAYFVQSLLDLYEATLEVRWLELAVNVQAAQDELFWDEKSAGYFTTAGTDGSLLVRMKDDHDGSEPAGNSVAALNLLRLAQMTDDAETAGRGERVLKLYAVTLQRAPTNMPKMVSAVDFHLDKPKQIVLAGDPKAPDTAALLAEVYAHYLPNKIVLAADGGEGQQFLAERAEFIKGIEPIDGKATAYVCENYACQEPTADVEVLRKQLTGNRP